MVFLQRLSGPTSGLATLPELRGLGKVLRRLSNEIPPPSRFKLLCERQFVVVFGNVEECDSAGSL